MNRIKWIVCSAVLCATAFTSDAWAQGALVLNGINNRVVDGGSYSSIDIRNSSNVTIRNANISRTTVGDVVNIQSSSAITFENNDIQGGGVACTGVNIGGDSSNVRLKGNRIHNIADDGIQAQQVKGLILEGNSIYSLLGIGTDSGGSCFNGHSDGIELFTVRDVQVTGNLIFDVRSNAAIFFGNTASSSADYNKNILIENNIFITPESGFVVYLFQADGVKLYNNVLWWGLYGGLAMGDHVTNLDVANNVLQSINYNHLKPPYVAGQHNFRNNLIGTTAGQATPAAILSGGNNFVQPDPQFANLPSLNNFGRASSYRQGSGGAPRFSAADLTPVAGSPLLDKGILVSGMALVDFRGLVRPQGKAIDIGAVERPVAGTPNPTPTPAPVPTPVPTPESAKQQSLFTSQVPKTLSARDGVNYELGMRFKVSSAGQIRAIRFYKSKSESGIHTGRIYSASGAVLARVRFSGETASGWQTQNLSEALNIAAGTEYVVSVNTGNMYYVATNGGLSAGLSNGALSALGNPNGVFGPVGKMPTQSYQGTNYFRDVIFVPSSVTAPAPAPQPAAPAPEPTPTSNAGGKCPLPKYPSDSCTGVPAGISLQTVSGGMTVKTAGQVIEGKLVTGDIYVQANDVIIRNSEVRGRIYSDNGSRFTVEDSTVGPASGCLASSTAGGIGNSNYTVRRVRVRGYSDAFRIGGSNILIEDSYVTVCSDDPENHSDGIQAYGASGATNITIRHNVIDQRSAKYGVNAPIFIPNDKSTQLNQGISVSVTDNVLAGGGYSLQLMGDLNWTGLAVTGNKIVNKSWSFGPLWVTCNHINSWSNNAVVNFDFNTGTITSQVQALNDCGN